MFGGYPRRHVPATSPGAKLFGMGGEGGEQWAFLGSSGKGNDDFELLESLPIKEGIVGSDPSCVLQLHDPMITPRHARVLCKDGFWYVGGIAAAAATWINDVATLPGEAVQLARGDVVRFGNARFCFGGEPRAREGVDPRDERSRLIWADRLAEEGDPLGVHVLKQREPDDELFERWVSGEDFPLVTEWTEHVLTGLTVRNLDQGRLRSLLSSHFADGLERLTVMIATMANHGDQEEEETRNLLQSLALTRPPRLRKLELGWLHQATDLARAQRDWSAVARRIPLEGSAQNAFKSVGLARFTMIRSPPWWPAEGTTTPVQPGRFRRIRPGRAMVDGQVFVDPLEPEGKSMVVFSHRPGHATVIHGEGLRINGHGPSAGGLADVATLVNGDLVESPHFAFRFEED